MRPPRSEEFEEDFDPPLPGTLARRTLIEQALEVVGSVAALARRLGTAPSHVSRARAGHVGLGVETSLRLADVLDEDPILILHKCGYGTLSDRLERLRQGETPRPRARLHEALDRLPRKDRRIVSGLIDRLLVDAMTDMPSADPPRKRATR